VDRLTGRTAHWTPGRWAASCPDGGPRRAEAVHALVQRLADLGADVERRPRRPVPRPEHDTVLPDQLEVMTADLLRAGGLAPAVLTTAAEDVEDVARRL
jgi:hypothetical protein